VEISNPRKRESEYVIAVLFGPIVVIAAYVIVGGFLFCVCEGVDVLKWWRK